MKIDIGEVLSRAAKITWNYKVLWLAGIIIALISLLSLPISLIFNDPFSFASNDPAQVRERILPLLLSNGLILLLSIVTIPVTVLGMSIPSLATRGLEMGDFQPSLRNLVRDALPYFWRVLGVFLLVWVGMFAVAFVFFACISVLSVLTLGFAALCAIPLFLLFIPVAIVVFALVELGMSAILVDNLGTLDAVQRAWGLIKQNLGAVIILSILIYVGSMAISMVLSIPMMIPMFGFFTKLGMEPDPQMLEKMFRNMTLWMLAFSPLYAVLQGILLTFMQSVWTLTYMRLVKPRDNSPVLLEAHA
jgi:hypothetical protein